MLKRRSPRVETAPRSALRVRTKICSPSRVLEAPDALAAATMPSEIEARVDAEVDARIDAMAEKVMAEMYPQGLDATLDQKMQAWTAKMRARWRRSGCSQELYPGERWPCSRGGRPYSRKIDRDR